MDFASKYRSQHPNPVTERDATSPREKKRIEEKRIEDEKMLQLAEEKKKRSLPRVIFSWAFQIALTVMLAYVTVLFFGQTRTNIGQSMDTTLSGGDIVLINTMAYQLSGPSRNDVISFRPGGNESSRSSIRRVIGLPGETVQIIDGMIYLNGQVYLEERNYPVMTSPGMASEPLRLSESQYFVLGDNRNNSEDSRFADVGLVEAGDIEGRAWYVISPSEHRGRIH